ncbi:hypothetical protein M0811_05734 [Anaeramoeba ignava]|uniref:Uncharacterized protein n=1 Tax=Anaeramoeba ignava TaxID=1746090 RepID=A0A9Q0LS09_ANAIG|nr:hypothetical protein M0811_05734 [Anaeramoeba ignava]
MVKNILSQILLIISIMGMIFCSRVKPATYAYTFQRQYNSKLSCILSGNTEFNKTIKTKIKMVKNILSQILLIISIMGMIFCSRVKPATYAYTFQRQYNSKLSCILSGNTEFNVTALAQGPLWNYITNSQTTAGISVTESSIPLAQYLNSNYQENSTFSIEIWVSNSGVNPKILIGDLSDPAYVHIYPQIESNGNSIYTEVYSGSTQLESGSIYMPGGIIGTTPKHLLINWQPGNQSLYLNSVYIGSTTLNSTIDYFFPCDLLIMKHNAYYVGTYDRILTPSEILDNYLAGIPGWSAQISNNKTYNSGYYHSFDFNDLYSFTNSSIHQIELLNTSSNGAGCSIYAGDPPLLISFPHTLDINETTIGIQTPNSPGETINCTIDYNIFFLDLNYDSTWEKNGTFLAIVINSSVDGPNFFPNEFDLYMSSIQNVTFTLNYEDQSGFQVTNFTVGLIDGILFYNETQVENGVPIDIVSPAQTGTLDFKYLMDFSNNDSDFTASFLFTLRSTSSNSISNMVNLNLNNSNINLTYNSVNLKEDEFVSVELIFEDSLSGNLDSNWEIVWIGDPMTGTQIKVNESNIFVGDTITSGSSSALNSASPFEISIEPKGNLSGDLQLEFMVKNDLVSFNKTLSFFVENKYDQASIYATCSSNCQNQQNKFVFSSSSFILNFVINNPDNQTLQLDLQLNSFEMKSASISQTQNITLSGTQSLIESQLTNFQVITSGVGIQGDFDILFINLTNSENSSDVFQIQYQIQKIDASKANFLIQSIFSFIFFFVFLI